ncbi:MAG: HAMP domain-containing protein [Cyanothece sp. SIO1E1]|nr:HAMP domain-containing protein [Cyanothece sp. SIO1E1]
MKIRTKFLGSSLAMLGSIVLLIAGSNCFINQAEQSIRARLNKTNQTIRLFQLLEVSLADQTAAIKDYLLVHEAADVVTYQQAKSNFRLGLDALEKQLPDATAIDSIRRQFHSLMELAQSIQATEADLNQMQMGIRTINSLRKDTEFYLDLLRNQLEQENNLVQLELTRLDQIIQRVELTLLGLVILIFTVQFRWMLLPEIRAIQMLRLGAEVIGNGNLAYRLKIKAGDEIEQVADAFNQMSAKLAGLYQSLEQKVIERTQSLERSTQQDHLLSRIAVQLLNRDIDTAINYALKLIGQFAASDRATIALYNDAQTHLSHAYEWRAIGIKPLMAQLQNRPITSFPWFHQHHIQGQIVQVSSVADLPPAAAAEKVILTQHEIGSILLVPIGNLQKIIGVISLETVFEEKFWNQEDINLLQYVGEIITIAYARHQVEQALQQKNKALTDSLRQLKTTQDELILAEKMAALGQLMAGIAHEINTPLGAIKASSSNTITALSESLNQIPELCRRLETEEKALFFELVERSRITEPYLSVREKRQFKRTLTQQLQMYGIDQAQRLADTLVDIGVHATVHPFRPLLQRTDVDWLLKLAYDLARLQINSQNILNAVDRAAKIVLTLKRYAHHDTSGEKQLAQITEGLDTAIELCCNQLRHNVEVKRNYSPLPAIWCYPDELIQVWTNLVQNAIQAMASKGCLTIQVAPHGDDVIVKVMDSGCGISPTIKHRIFEPFFTTKSAGEGCGLGLDIACQIVKKHGGSIEVESVPGQTIFQVRLPIDSDNESWLPGQK